MKAIMQKAMPAPGRALRHFHLLNKRLLKKPSFVLILLLIPFMCLCMVWTSRETSDIVTVAIAQESPADDVGRRIIGELALDERAMHFITCQKPEEAMALLDGGRTDAVWIFAADTERRIAEFCRDPEGADAVVQCIESEDTALMKIAREKLYAAIYAECTRPMYISYVRESSPELDGLSDAELMEYYDGLNISDGLFEFSYVGEGERPAENKGDHLIAPMRGLLAVLMLLCSLASALYYMQDEERGVFVWVSEGERPLFSFIYHFTALFDAGAAVALSLVICGVWTRTVRELAAMLIYMLGCTAFCILVRRICKTVGILSALTPVIVLSALVICPVFMQFVSNRLICGIFPTYHYLMALHDGRYLLSGLLYACIVLLIDLGWYRIARRIDRKRLG